MQLSLSLIMAVKHSSIFNHSMGQKLAEGPESEFGFVALITITELLLSEPDSHSRLAGRADKMRCQMGSPTVPGL